MVLTVSCKEDLGTDVEVDFNSGSGEVIAEEIRYLPASIELSPGESQRIQVSAKDSYGGWQDVTEKLTFTIADQSMLRLSEGSTNKFVAMKSGQGIVNFEYQGQSHEIPFLVADKQLMNILLSPESQDLELKLFLGKPQAVDSKITAVGVYSDGSTADISDAASWSITSEVASGITPKEIGGEFNISDNGEFFIDAYFSGLHANGKIASKIETAEIVELQSQPKNLVMPLGTSLTMSFKELFSDSSLRDIQNQITMTTADGSPLSFADIYELESMVVDGATVKGSKLGKESFVISTEGLSQEFELQVYEPIGAEIEISSPRTFSEAKGRVLGLTATLVFTNDDRMDVTDQVKWETSSASYATFSFAEATKNGQVKLVKKGLATITASLGEISSDVEMYVVDEETDFIQLATSDALGTEAFPKGTTRAFFVEVVSTDGLISSPTDNPTYEIVDGAGIASVSGSGVVTSLSQGTFKLKVSYDSFEGVLDLVVSDPIITSFAIEPNFTPPLSVGATEDLQVFVVYSDNSKVDKTSDSIWTYDVFSSGFNDAGYVLDTAGNKGKTTGVRAGQFKAIATFEGRIAEYTLSVVD